MYKTDLVRRVAKDTRLSQKVVSDVIIMALKEMSLSLAKADNVIFPGFGTFYTRVRAASEVRSFTTGKPIKIPARRVADFRAGELLKQAVRKSK